MRVGAGLVPALLQFGRIYKGAIPKHTPEILSRLNIGGKHWIYLTRDFESPLKTLVGSVHHIRQACPNIYQHTILLTL